MLNEISQTLKEKYYITVSSHLYVESEQTEIIDTEIRWCLPEVGGGAGGRWAK